MASPEKKFLDPVGLSQMGACFAPGLVPIPERYRTASWIPAPAFAHLMVSLPQRLPQTHVPAQVQIPPPPMGRVVISTFPPIYRERGAASRPSFGQIQPRGLK